MGYLGLGLRFKDLEVGGRDDQALVLTKQQNASYVESTCQVLGEASGIPADARNLLGVRGGASQKLGGTIMVVPIIRTVVYWGL